MKKLDSRKKMLKYYFYIYITSCQISGRKSSILAETFPLCTLVPRNSLNYFQVFEATTTLNVTIYWEFRCNRRKCFWNIDKIWLWFADIGPRRAVMWLISGWDKIPCTKSFFVDSTFQPLFIWLRHGTFCTQQITQMPYACCEEQGIMNNKGIWISLVSTLD